ncbi:MAG: transcription termination factor Rho [Lachnospiraceae bacterium]|nr:transcription termination factor Rho [Lachnospiraceae bacterium]
MREKLNTLPLAELKELAKAQGLKGISALRKAELIELLCRQEDGNSEGRAAEEQTLAAEGRNREAEGQNRAAEERTAAAEGQTPAADSQASAAEVRRSGQQAEAAERREVRTSEAEEPGRRPYGNAGEQRGGSAEGAREGGQRTAQASSGEPRSGSADGARDGGRPPRGRADSRGNRVVTRFENRSGGYQNRRNGDNNGRSQQYGRSQDSRNSDSRTQDYSRGQGGRNQDYSNGPDSRSQDAARQPENSQGMDSGNMPDSGRFQNVGRTPEYGSTGNPDSRQDMRSDNRPDTRSDTRFADMSQEEAQTLDSGLEANGILEVMPDGFGFIRCENFLPGDNDVYVAPSQIRRFNMKTGDIIRGNRRVKAATEKFAALLYVTSINGFPVSVAERRPNFEDLTPIFPNQRIHMETASSRGSLAMRVLDLMAPIGKGQRGMIVSPPKAGKTTLLKQVAKAITTNQPNMHLIILLIDERPEEVTDIKEAIVGENVEVIYSTFDELPERHKRVSEMVIERARRLVEHGRDVTILLDSITRLARAYNLVVPPSGRTLSGGLDPAALHMPKRFFGAARNMREGGSLTVLATALIDTGSRMDDVIYEEFKGTGNMELVLDRKLSERRIFPALDVLKSGTRRDDLLLSREEAEAVEIIRRASNSMKQEDFVEKLLDLFAKTRSNQELVAEIRRRRYL